MCDPPLSGRYVTSAVCKVAVDRVAFLLGLTARRWHSNQQSEAQNMMDTTSSTIATHLSRPRRRSSFCHKYNTLQFQFISCIYLETADWKLKYLEHPRKCPKLQTSNVQLIFDHRPVIALVSRNNSGHHCHSWLDLSPMSVECLQLSLSGPEQPLRECPADL